jgi:SnoaL-like domain
MTIVSTEQAMTTDAARIRELLLINLFVVFSERDPERRLKAIVANYTEDVVWSDSEATTHGHEELNERAQVVLDSTPDFVFTAAGPVNVLRDLGVLAFTYGLPEQPPAVTGSDVALVRDGRIAVLYTLMDGSPTGDSRIDRR